MVLHCDEHALFIVFCCTIRHLKLEQRIMFIFCVKLGNNPVETYEMLCTAYGDKTLSWAQTFWRFKHFQEDTGAFGWWPSWWMTYNNFKHRTGARSAQFIYKRPFVLEAVYVNKTWVKAVAKFVPFKSHVDFTWLDACTDFLEVAVGESDCLAIWIEIERLPIVR